ncbi:unnamed protein product [Closterium sp. Naga37s-1]|nr:unnamed protein product [Closterium sp. Naga37s-1]
MSQVLARCQKDSSFARSAGDFSDGCGGTAGACPAGMLGGCGMPPCSVLLTRPCADTCWFSSSPRETKSSDASECEGINSLPFWEFSDPSSPPFTHTGVGVELPSRVSLLFPLCLHGGSRGVRQRCRLSRSPVQALNPDRPAPRESPLSLVLPPTACPTQFPGLSSSSVFPGELLAGSWVILPLVAASCLAARFPDVHGQLPPCYPSRRFPLQAVVRMTTNALALVATALAEASPGGVPGPQPRSRMFTAAAAADIPEDSAAVGANGSFGGCSGCLAASATTAAISTSPRGDGDTATNGAGESADPCSTCASSAATTSSAGGAVGPAAGAVESSSEAATGTAAGECASRPIPVGSASAAAPCSPRRVKPDLAAATSPRKSVSSAPASTASAAGSSCAAKPSCPACSSCCRSCRRAASPR